MLPGLLNHLLRLANRSICEQEDALFQFRLELLLSLIDGATLEAGHLLSVQKRLQNICTTVITRHSLNFSQCLALIIVVVQNGGGTIYSEGLVS